MTRKEIGRITRATFGYGGYDDAMVGLGLSFGGPAWGVHDFTGTWATRPPSAEWSEADQRERWGDAVAKLRDTLQAARKHDVSELEGVPVEVTFEGNRLVSWRVLTEVIG